MKFLLLLIVRIHILISKKCSQKCSHSVDFYCNLLKFKISRIALNQDFYRLLTCSESLFHLSKNHVLTQFWWVFFQLKTVWSVAFVFWSKVQAFTRFFVFKCNVYAHGISLLLFSWSSFSDFTSLVVSFQRYTVRTWVISSSFIKFHSWSCYFIVSTTFIFLRFWSATCRYCHFFLPPLRYKGMKKRRKK